MEDLERQWGIHVTKTLTGGSGSYVATAVTASGTEVVLKVAIPDGLEGHPHFAKELLTLRLGAGRGYVRVLRADETRNAMLHERLGRSLTSLARPVEAQIDVIVATLRQAWRRVPKATPLRTGAMQAQYLSELIMRKWEALGQPCDRRTIERAEQFAATRHDAYDPSTAVLIHGDAHPTNVLEDPSTPGRFKLIDPDGMLSEPAHDLAIPLRDWTDELLAGDAVEAGVGWCAQLSAKAGVDAKAIWEWAFVERVSTGLFLTRAGG